MSNQSKPRGTYTIYNLESDHLYPGLAAELRDRFEELGWDVVVEEIPHVTGVGSGFSPQDHDDPNDYQPFEFDRWADWVDAEVERVLEQF